MIPFKSPNKFILAMFCLYFVNLSFGQVNFLPGYVINQEGDTLQGFVDYRDWEKNPDQIAFRRTETGDKTTFSPNEIKAFVVDDELYVAATVEVETSPFKTSDLVEDEAFQFKTSTVFLQAIVVGEKSLYYYKNVEGRNSLYIWQNEQYELLKYKKYIKKEDGKRFIRENQRYIGQLHLYLHDCPEMANKLRGIQYTPKSVEKRFKAYYACMAREANFHREPDGVLTQWYLIGGPSLNTIKFTAERSMLLADTEFKPSLDAAVGGALDLVLERIRGRWSVYFELMLANYSMKGHYENIESENRYTIGDVTLGLTYVKLNTMVRYKFPLGTKDLFINAGLSNGLAVLQKNVVKLEEKSYTTETISEEEFFPDPRRLEQGIIGGVGVKGFNVSVEGRVEIGNGISSITGISSQTMRFYLLVGYRI